MWKDSETEIDFLDFDYLIAMIEDIIEDESLLPSSVGVYGDWGSGKSSLIRMSIKEFEKKENDTVSIVFNGWLFEGYEDAKTALMGTILDTIQSNRTLNEKAKKCLSGLYKSVDKFKLLKNGARYGADFLVTGGIGTVTELTLKNIFSKLGESGKGIDQEAIFQALQDEMSNKEIREDIKQFQQNFADLLAETKIKRLVVFIDELDRCSPDTILETLEAIRLFLFTGNSVFIIGADERHISYAVKRKFDEIEGQQINIGKEYLEKIIQYPIRIPRLNKEEVEYYITCLLFEKDLTTTEFEQVITFLKQEKIKNFLNFNITYTLLSTELPVIAEKVKESISISKQLSSVLSNGLNGNPRHCKRFLNSLVMREKMANYKNVHLDRKVLAKIMLLEYFKAPLFRKIAALTSIGNGKSEELKQLENFEVDDSNELKVWKEDKWVEDWCEIDPKLSDLDLRSYFYFARESLSEKVSFNTEKLSPIATKIIEMILSKSKISRNEALQKASEINDYEATNILEVVFDELISHTQIDKDLFKVFLDWGKAKENLHTNVISNLGSIHGEKITLPMLPSIKGFMSETNKEIEILEVTHKWMEENQTLAPAKKKRPLHKRRQNKWVRLVFIMVLKTKILFCPMGLKMSTTKLQMTRGKKVVLRIKQSMRKFLWDPGRKLRKQCHSILLVQIITEEE